MPLSRTVWALLDHYLSLKHARNASRNDTLLIDAFNCIRKRAIIIGQEYGTPFNCIRKYYPIEAKTLLPRAIFV